MTGPVPNKLEADLSAYLDGELTPEGRAAVERLLAESPAARALLAQLRSVSEQLATLPRQQAPADLAAMLQRHAERQLLFGSRRTLVSCVLRIWPQLTASAAVLVACMWVGWYTLRTISSAPGSTPPAIHTPAAEPSQTPMVPNAVQLAAVPPVRDEIVDSATKGAVERVSGDMTVAARSARAGVDSAVRALEEPAPVVRAEASLPLAVAAPPEAPIVASSGGTAAAPVADAPLAVATEAEADGAAVVQITVVTTDIAEYDAVRETLIAWRSAPAPAGGNIGGAAGTARATPVRETLHVPATELKARIDALGDVVAARSQVHVQMNLDASASDVLAQAGGARPEPPAPVYAYYLERWATFDYLRRAPADSAVLRGQRFGTPLRPGTRTAEATQPATSATTSRPEGADTVASDSDAMCDQEFGRAYNERLNAAMQKGRPDNSAARRDLQTFPGDSLRARHRAATESEDVEIVFVDPPTSQPEDECVGRTATALPPVDPRAAQAVVDLTACILWDAAWDALNRVDAQVLALLEGAVAPPPPPPPPAEDVDAYVAFEILVLPPPTAEPSSAE